jgi:hypothetical protein
MKKTDDGMIFGSAAGVSFVNMFLVNPVFEGQASMCGAPTATLLIDVEVTISRDGEQGATGKGVCNVEFVGLLAGIEQCVQDPAPMIDQC